MLFILAFYRTPAFAVETHEVDQQNKSFTKNGQKITRIQISVGDKITFKNIDSVIHNIYSMSEIKQFNLGAIDRGESKSVQFNEIGTARVSCAIHPRMIVDVIVNK